jgi:hypothetical protein
LASVGPPHISPFGRSRFVAPHAHPAVDAYVEGHEPMMEHYGIGAHVFALLWGFLFGIFFIGINAYVFLIFLGFALSVLIYSAFISSVAHAGFYVSYYVVFLFF